MEVKKMPRFYVKDKNNKWNIFSTVIDDFLYDDFVDFNILKGLVVKEVADDKCRELDTLLTDKPELNIMSYEEAVGKVSDDNE